MPLKPDEIAALQAETISLEDPPSLRRMRWQRGKRAFDLLLNFSVGQGALQALGVVTGLLLVRRLSLDAYAQLGLAMGFQGVVSILMDLGFASTIVPLVGDRRDDRVLVGRYVRSAQHLRNRSFFVLAPFAAAALFAMMHRHHWSWGIQIVLAASVLLALYSGGKVSYTSAPYLLHGRLREFYGPQVVTAGARLLIYSALSVAGQLNAWTAAALNALNMTANGRLLEKRSQSYLDWPGKADPATTREMLQYMLPAAPATIFAAFQSQISLFLISIFGGTVDVAQVAALGRLGQLFAVLTIFNVVVVEPWFARLRNERVFASFLVVMLLASAGCVPLIFLAFLHPGFYLWMLGAKYAGLAPHMGLMITGACINFVAGVIWIMNRGRKWLFWSGTWLEIGLLLTVQIAFVSLVGVRTVRQAVEFTFAASFCPLVAHLYVSMLGFARGARAVPQAAETPA